MKWDGADKVCANLPGRPDILRVYALARSRTPGDMPAQEFGLLRMASQITHDGWVVVTPDSRRLVFSR
jgi:hypothetical protein